MQQSFRFNGPVSFSYDGVGPLPGEVRGSAAEPDTTLLVRMAARPGDFPDTLQDVILFAPAAAQGASQVAAWSLSVAGRVMPLTSPPVIHRDAQALAEAVIRPRAVRWRTRIFWRLVFVLMNFSVGRALLLRLYQR